MLCQFLVISSIEAYATVPYYTCNKRLFPGNRCLKKYHIRPRLRNLTGTLTTRLLRNSPIPFPNPSTLAELAIPPSRKSKTRLYKLSTGEGRQSKIQTYHGSRLHLQMYCQYVWEFAAFDSSVWIAFDPVITKQLLQTLDGQKAL